MKNGLTCECGNAKARGRMACDRCLAIENNLWRWLPFRQRPADRLLTESEQGAKAFEARFDDLPHGKNRELKLYRLRCANCQTEFTAKRRHAKTCSDNCRSKLSRLTAVAA